MTEAEIIKMAFDYKVAFPVTHELTPVMMKYHEDHLQALVKFVHAIETKLKEKNT